MTHENKTLDEFANDENHQDGADSDEREADTTTDGEDEHPLEEETVLFRFTSDPFVNEGIAELARRLSALGVPVEISPEQVVLAPEGNVEQAVDHIESCITDSLSNTHRRRAVAFAINRALMDMPGARGEDDDRWVPQPSIPFPEKGDKSVTVYEDETVHPESLEEAGLSLDYLDREVQEDDSLYRLSEEFVGNNQKRSFDSQRRRFERYFKAYRDTLAGDTEAGDSPCMACGTTAMPAYKHDDENLEYNQSFTILAAGSGQAVPLGARTKADAHRGRCAACLIAGFYYTLMPKVVRPTATNKNDTRIFTPVGNLEELVSIRADLSALLVDIDEPTSENMYPRRQTLGEIYTNSIGFQTIEFYELILRHVFREVSDGLYEQDVEYRPTALTSYVSEVGRTRDIRAMKTIDPDTWAYDAVCERELDSGEQYWPVADALAWFASLDEEDPSVIEYKNNIAYGILDQDLVRLERGVFEVAKAIERTDATIAQYTPSISYLNDYFQYTMKQTVSDTESIDDDSIESIRSVASGLGQIFHDRDDLGVLIQLQNASTPQKFLESFEKAAMQAQKKSIDTPPMAWQTSRDEDVEEVLRLIKNPETFDPAKRMFVIHASLAAQYQNVKEQSDSDGDDASSDTGGEQ
jgi:hypothetical protein